MIIDARRSIRLHVMLMIGTLILVVVGLSAVLLRSQALTSKRAEAFSRDTVQSILETRIRQRAESRVVELADALVNPVYYFDLDAIGSIASAVSHSPDISYVLVFDTEGRILHDGNGDIPTYGQRMEDDLAANAIGADQPVIQSTPQVLDAAAPIMLAENRLGGVRIGYSLAASHAMRDAMVKRLDAEFADISWRMRWQLFAVGALLLAICAVALWVVGRYYVRPILRLAEQARFIERGDFPQEMAVSSGRLDEIGELGRSFYRMSESVRRHTEEARHLAMTDTLTLLPNRRSFHARLAESLSAMRPGRALALLFVDLDDFKRINDSYGHDIGDLVLVQMAERFHVVLNNEVPGDFEIARFGGDEFVILLHGAAARQLAETAARVAQRLIAAGSEGIALESGERVGLGASIGITLYPRDAGNPVTLVKNGDIAMYQAKSAGKYCYRFYHPSMEQVVKRRVHMEQALQEAWARDELSLVYQPIHCMARGGMVGAEALLRWCHPDMGAVSPSVFIAVAEESGLIEKFGTRIIETACRDAMHWQAIDGRELFVSVNLSVRQLRDESLPEQITRILQDTGMPAHRLHMELTETMVLDGAVDSRSLLKRLRDTGVTIWLDDFGTGFSGLSHLRKLPVDGVKIDRTFVADILHDADDRALTRAIIGMAQSLDMVVVAEGIEEQGQYDLLRDAGCELGQGFLLSEPISQDELLRMLAISANPPRRDQPSQ
ncbi:MAG: EAL domain-containing protein [Pseudomonadota bacterium]|nr:EAL domain-containing protein [Pseudomonadota bacterium]